MNNLAFLTHTERKTPKITPLDTVRVHQKIREGNKERIQKYEGLVIAMRGPDADRRITVRKIASGVGVERIFAVNSPNIEKIELVKTAKSRRSKHYYMRNRFGKSARQKGVVWIRDDQQVAEAPEVVAEEKAEDTAVGEAPTEEKAEEIKAEAPVEEKVAEAKEEVKAPEAEAEKKAE